MASNSGCDLPLLAAMQVLGVKEYHRSCTENLHEGLSELGLVPPEVSALLTHISVTAALAYLCGVQAPYGMCTHDTVPLALAPMMSCDKADWSMSYPNLCPADGSVPHDTGA